MKIMNLGELGQFNNGVNFSSDKMGRGVPLINVKDITGSHRISISKLDLVEMNITPTMEAKDGDLFFVRSSVKREGIGMSAKLRDSNTKAIHCGFVIRFRPTSQEIVSDYLLYLLKSPKYREMLRNLSSGVSIINLSQNNLRTLPITIYPIAIQQKTVDILSAYDDLIDTNRRRIQLLEESARLLFREWFVYFRFPGHEKVKIVDGVPEGWKRSTLGIIANRIKKNYSINDEDLNLVDLARMNSRTLSVTDVGVASDLETARIIFEKDDVLFSSIRPYLHKVVVAPFKGITNTSVFVIRTKNPIYCAYITLLLFSDYAIQFANQHSTGTKMPVVKWSSVSKLPALIPPQIIMEAFQNIVWPMLEQIELAYFRNQKLTQARDLLLPRLMSGAIGV